MPNASHEGWDDDYEIFYLVVLAYKGENREFVYIMSVSTGDKKLTIYSRNRQQAYTVPWESKQLVTKAQIPKTCQWVQNMASVVVCDYKRGCLIYPNQRQPLTNAQLGTIGMPYWPRPKLYLHNDGKTVDIEPRRD